MTVREAIQGLMEHDLSAIVVLSIDEEGNGFGPLRDIAGNSVYDEDDRMIYISELTDELRVAGYTDEDVGEGAKAVVLWPG